ncbi:MAG: chorismate synthase [Victivallaceae bacterium]|nr:chorismate synthase [Victivallaceae bacterium]
MASTFGKALKFSIFGESHGRAIGGVADGFPPGEKIDETELARFLARRKPGQKGTTPRRESDRIEILSGVYRGKTTGAPLALLIENRNTRSADYEALQDVPRPGHADLAALLRYGESADRRGGGHFSGRLTAPLTAFGGIAKQILERRSVFIGAHLAAAGTISDAPFDAVSPTREALLAPGEKSFPVHDDAAGTAMQKAIFSAAKAGDSLGGIVECCALGFPEGIGTPMFDRIECRLAQLLFGIPAVRGVEFGNGFGAAALSGSENNDPFVRKGKKIVTASNRHGGALGGISSGMPILFRVAFKPTPSIAAEQKSVDLRTGKTAKLCVAGRHDPCVAVRAVPVVEAAAALVLLDLLLSEKKVVF